MSGRPGALALVAAAVVSLAAGCSSTGPVVRAEVSSEDIERKLQQTEQRRMEMAARAKAVRESHRQWADAVDARREAYAGTTPEAVFGKYLVYAKESPESGFEGEVVVLPIRDGATNLVVATADRALLYQDGMKLLGNLYWEVRGGISSVALSPSTRLELGDGGDVQSFGAADTLVGGSGR